MWKVILLLFIVPANASLLQPIRIDNKHQVQRAPFLTIGDFTKMPKEVQLGYVMGLADSMTQCIPASTSKEEILNVVTTGFATTSIPTWPALWAKTFLMQKYNCS